ncbi:putative ureidoglycolate hydrolase [Camillea tinctor]|nr:putative ureidoglycolate hydrolase [Camillea tinctor]
MIIHTIPTPSSPLIIEAEPFTREAFAPFGQAINNPRPDLIPSPSSSSSAAVASAGFGAVSANQGTAIQYRALASVREFYAQAPSGRPGTPRMTMFVCGAREEVGASLVGGEARGKVNGKAKGKEYPVGVLERHPFTSQTFIPLGGAGAAARYLVVVAPSLGPTERDAALPVPTLPFSPAGGVPHPHPQPPLPGRGLPDLRALRAFVATGAQAVTYGPGTWHAPMMALGAPGEALDFLVVQFANDVPVEDCQEVVLRTAGDGEGGGDKGPSVVVRVRGVDGEKGGARL